jgi:hypothetical protein
MELPKKINLKECLEYIEKPPEENIQIFFDINEKLKTFFNYKENIIEIYKENAKIEYGKSTIQDIEEDLRSQLVSYIQQGYKIFLFCGYYEYFDVLEFFGKLSWFSLDLFKNKNYLDKKFLLDSKILTENEDFDLTKTYKGGYKVHESARLYFLCGTSEEEIETFMKINSGLPLEVIIVE